MYINSVCVCAHVRRGRWIGLGKLAIGCLCGGEKNTIFDADHSVHRAEVSLSSKCQIYVDARKLINHTHSLFHKAVHAYNSYIYINTVIV